MKLHGNVLMNKGERRRWEPTAQDLLSSRLSREGEKTNIVGH